MEKNNFQTVLRLNEINSKCNFYLTGVLGVSMCGLIFFKLLIVDFASYTQPWIEPLLFIVSALSTVICVNGWMLSYWAKICFSIGSLIYPTFPLICRAFDLKIIENEIIEIDKVIAGEINITLLAMLSCIVYSTVFQSFQLAMLFWIRRKSGELVGCIEQHLIPYEKREPNNFHMLNQTIKLRMMLKGNVKSSITVQLWLLRKKLPSMAKLISQ